MKKKHLGVSLIFFIVLCLFVEIIGGYWTHETISTWYPTLIKPSWTPPNWLFGPVWTTLYFMIAVSGWLIYRAEDTYERAIALILYSFQLVLNLMWSYLFFSLKNPLMGFIDIVLLIILTNLTIIKFWKISPLASILLIPYSLWLMYAASLNLGILLLN